MPDRHPPPPDLTAGERKRWSLRSFIGLCEHRWQDTGHIEGKVPNLWRTSLAEPAFVTINIYVTQRCTVCGSVRSVKL